MPMWWTRRGLQQIRQQVPWLRWLRAWRDDHEQHAASRAEARAHAPLHPGERLLTVAREADGELLAATDRALYHQTRHDWTRLGWDEVGRIDWDAQRHVLVLTGVTPAVAARTVLRLAKEWQLPALVAERVRWANLLDQRISLNRDAGARVIARRVPGEAHVKWLIILDRGLDRADPGVRAELESALAELRALTGLERGPGRPARMSEIQAGQAGCDQ